MTRPACTSDACRCGRAPCPTPDACLLPEPDRERIDPQLIALYAACAVALLAVLVMSSI